MGKITKNFRQTNRTGRADTANKNYARVNRAGSWGKIINIFKKGDKPKWQG